MKTNGNYDDPLATVICKQIALRSISDLIPYPGNARKHNKSQIQAIAKCISEVGFNAPVLVDKHFSIIAGHGRVEAAKLLGLSQVPVICLDHLSDAQAKAYRLADNKLTDRSGWDEGKLAVELKGLADLATNFDLEVTGFELPEIDFRLQSLEDISSIDRADEFQLSSGPPVSRLGDMWQLGEHRVVCGDARDAKALEALMAGAKATAVFTDPPYNVKIDGHVTGNGATRHREFAMAAGEMSEPAFTSFLTEILTGIIPHIILGALIYACMDWRHMAEMLSAGRSSGYELLNICVWVKSNGGMGSLYRSRHEFVFLFKNGSDPHLNNIQLGRFGRNRTNVWNYSGANAFARRGSKRGLELHPTVKPVLMVADAIQDSTNRNDIVLDLFLGSGTTLIAAERVNRRCYGLELDPLYVDTVVERWQRMTGRKAHNHLGESFDRLKSQRMSADD